MLEGSGVRIHDGVEHAVETGDFWQTPGNVPHGFRAGPEGAVVLDIFSPPREEYRRGKSGLSAKLSGTGRPAYILNPDRQEPAAKTELVTSMIERSWRAWSGDGLGVKFAGVPGPWRQAAAAQLSA